MPDPFDKSQIRLNRSPLDDPNVMSGPFWGELRVFLAVAKAKSSWQAAEKAALKPTPPDKRLPEIRKKLQSLDKLGQEPRPATGRTP